MAKKETLWETFKNGTLKNNPIFVSLLGMCPTLAVTTALYNGLAMGLATSFVLIFSSIIISSIRYLVPNQVRIASYIVIIASFVTVVDYIMKAQFPAMSKQLGPFIPLIIVNCIVLGRQEAFASKNNPIKAFLDALGTGLGFTGALLLISGIREILGNGTLAEVKIMPDFFEPWIVMILPAGAFLTLGFLLGLFNFIKDKKKRKADKKVIEDYKSKKTRIIAAEG
jgi:electron transport complex protein RnfE